MQPLTLGQALNCSNLLFSTFANRRYARPGRFAINEHRASPALTFAAAIFAAGERQVVPQHAQQAVLARDRNFAWRAVDEEADRLLHGRPLSSKKRFAAR